MQYYNAQNFNFGNQTGAASPGGGLKGNSLYITSKSQEKNVLDNQTNSNTLEKPYANQIQPDSNVQQYPPLQNVQNSPYSQQNHQISTEYNQPTQFQSFAANPPLQFNPNQPMAQPQQFIQQQEYGMSQNPPPSNPAVGQLPTVSPYAQMMAQACGLQKDKFTEKNFAI
ncbi:hypothetical protein HDV06_006802 [Boothiomyces sp. JEL0866]|nr:hypothetical protein HDV06_006802 [Boothiomyces sp. JEL0866]